MCGVMSPVPPFGRRTVLHSQVEPQGTGQLTRTERRTQTLNKDRNLNTHGPYRHSVGEIRQNSVMCYVVFDFCRVERQKNQKKKCR